jgi:zinc protease
MTLHQGDEKALFGKTPLGSLSAAMLKRGTATRSRQQIEDELDALRSKFEVDGGETTVTVAGESVRSKLADTLRIVADVLRTPSFPAPEFDKLKREIAASLEERRKEPESIAQRALDRLGNPYPAGDVRYAPTLDEELKMFAGAELDDVRKFHAQFTGASYAELAIVGDFDADAIKALVTELFGSWKSPAPFTRVPEPLVAKPATTLKLETPEKANAMLLGSLALPLTDSSPDYPAMAVATYVLGEAGSSRLWKRRSPVSRSGTRPSRR